MVKIQNAIAITIFQILLLQVNGLNVNDNMDVSLRKLSSVSNNHLELRSKEYNYVNEHHERNLMKVSQEDEFDEDDISLDSLESFVENFDEKESDDEDVEEKDDEDLEDKENDDDDDENQEREEDDNYVKTSAKKKDKNEHVPEFKDLLQPDKEDSVDFLSEDLDDGEETDSSDLTSLLKMEKLKDGKERDPINAILDEILKDYSADSIDEIIDHIIPEQSENQNENNDTKEQEELKVNSLPISKLLGDFDLNSLGFGDIQSGGHIVQILQGIGEDSFGVEISADVDMDGIDDITATIIVAYDNDGEDIMDSDEIVTEYGIQKITDESGNVAFVATAVENVVGKSSTTDLKDKNITVDSATLPKDHSVNFDNLSGSNQLKQNKQQNAQEISTESNGSIGASTNIALSIGIFILSMLYYI